MILFPVQHYKTNIYKELIFNEIEITQRQIRPQYIHDLLFSIWLVQAL